MRVTSRTILLAALLLSPAPAAAQPTAFAAAFAEFAAAIEGTLGDEGPRVVSALDAMTRALDEWDRAIAAEEARAGAGGARTRVSLGRIYAERGRPDAALRHLDEAVRHDPADADAHLVRGLVLASLGRMADAREALVRARALDPKNPITGYYLLRHAAAAGDGDGDQVRSAREALQSSYTTSLRAPGAAPVRFTVIGRVVGDSSGVPLLPLHVYARGYTRLLQGDYDGAVADWRRAAAGDPLVTRHASEGRRALGLVAWAKSDYATSIGYLEAAVRAAPDDERSRLALARVLTTVEKDSEARGVLEDTVRLLPDSALAHWSLAKSYEAVNRFDEARREFELAAAAASGGRSALLAGIGRLAAGAADLSAAIEAFSRGVDADIDSAAAHMYLGAALMQQDRTDEAMAEFLVAALIDPRQPRAHLGIGEISLNTGNHRGAVDALRRALELSPALIPARYALATALARLGDAEQAAREFERVEAAQRQALEDRRRTMSLDVKKEGDAIRGTTPP